MKRLRQALAIVFALLPLSLGAQALSGQGVIPLSSGIYALMDSLYLENGFARPDLARPWTKAQAGRLLEKLDAATLSEAGDGAYAAIVDALTPRPIYSEDGFSYGCESGVSPEFYAHVPLGGDSGATAENYSWIHGWEARKSLLSFPLEAAFGDSIWLFSDVQVKEEHDTVESSLLEDATFPRGVTDNWSNLVFDDPNPRIDLYFPFRALSSTGGSHWNFRIGRDGLDWGNGRSGNLLLSDWSDFYDFAQLGFSGGIFSMTSAFASMDAWLPDGTRENSHGFMGHRFDFRIGKRVLVSVNEAVAFGGTTEGEDPDLLRDTNFLMVFHNWGIPKRANSMLSLEASYVPWKYFGIYAQVAMDEFATQYELSQDGGGGPPIFGALGGVDASVPIGPGYLDAAVECVVTSPWLYNRRAAPYYTNVRRYWSLTTNRFELMTKSIGYRYGPDSVVIFLGGSYSIPGKWKAGMESTWLRQGEKTLTSAWAPAPGDAPLSGIVEDSFLVSLRGEWEIFPWLSVEAGGNAAFVRNRDHVEGQWRDDLELTASFMLKYPSGGFAARVRSIDENELEEP